MKTEIKAISPKLAEQWMSVNQGNRHLRNSLVQQYADDMANGRWRLTHQGIAFDKDGNILDGQHRLQAVIISKCTILMAVTWGVPREFNEAVDSGAKRNFSDSLWFKNTVTGADTQKWYPITSRGMNNRSYGGTYTNRTLSISELHEFSALHHQAIVFSIKAFSLKGWPKGLKTKVLLGPVARAYYTQPLDRLNDFARVMNTGITSCKEESAAIKLRTYLLAGTADYMQLRMRKSARALEAFVANEPLAKLFDPGSPVFEIPENESQMKDFQILLSTKSEEQSISIFH